MDDVINGMWMSDESLCIELSRDLLESGAEILLSVKKVSAGFRVRPTAQMDDSAEEAYLNRMCAMHECDDCPAYDRCEEDLEKL